MQPKAFDAQADAALFEFRGSVAQFRACPQPDPGQDNGTGLSRPTVGYVEQEIQNPTLETLL